jgi:hypothetical protein
MSLMLEPGFFSFSGSFRVDDLSGETVRGKQSVSNYINNLHA